MVRSHPCEDQLQEEKEAWLSGGIKTSVAALLRNGKG